jgi:SmpA / OmlA family
MAKFIAALTVVFMLLSTAVFAAGRILNPELLDKIKPGVTTEQEVEQILGAPRSRSDFSRLGLVAMNYEMRVWDDWFDVGVMIGKDGIVRDIQRVKRYRGG